ncbi:MAG TPA: HlyD family efflux transporter periplasmic adaptor subunit [Thermoanaerobaculia bacterium]
MSWIASIIRWTRITLGAVVVVAAAFFIFARVAITKRAPGEIEVGAYHKVRPEVGGIISTVAVRNGAMVAAGIPLFAVGDPQREMANQQTLRELEETRIALNAALREHDALLNRIHPLERARQVNTTAQVQLEISRMKARVEELRSSASALAGKHKRTQEMHEQGIASKAELDQAKDNAEQAVWQLRQVEIEMEKSRLAAAGSVTDVDLVTKQQETALAQSRRDIEQFRARTATLERAMAEAARLRGLETVRSNIAGVVVGSEPRELVGKRVEPGEVVFSVVDPTAIRFRALVAEEDVVPVRPGQQAIIELAGLPKTKYRVFHGRVLTIDRQPTRSAPGEPGVYAVVIAVDDPWVKTHNGPTMSLPIGMRGTARIISRPHVGLIEAVREWITG